MFLRTTQYTASLLDRIAVISLLECSWRRHSQTYYNSQVPPVLGYNQDPPLLNTLNSATLTYDYSEEVVWRADRVEVDQTEFNGQGLTKYNADHDWACSANTTSGFDDLQTYIRGETVCAVKLVYKGTVLVQLPTSLPLS